MGTMERSKSKTPVKTKKASEGGKMLKGRKVTPVKSGPSEEEIRVKAREIYYERMSRGEHGNAESDWNEAKKILGS
jgi:hypothetical protein